MVVIGDSLANSAAQKTRLRLADQTVSYNSFPGITWGHWIPMAPGVPSEAVVVVELGANSVWDGWSSADQIDLELFLDALGSPRCTVLLTVAASALPTTATGEPVSGWDEASLNTSLGEAAEERTASGAPTFVAPWSDQAYRSGVLGPDHLHLTPRGEEVWSVWVAGLVHRITSSGRCRA